MCSIRFLKKNSQLSKEYYIYFLHREHCHLQSQNGTKASLPLHHLLSNHRPLSSHAAAPGQLDSGTWHQQQLIQLAAFLTSPHTQCFISQLELAVSFAGIHERIKNFTFPKSFV
jgi:hypothetical protein